MIRLLFVFVILASTSFASSQADLIYDFRFDQSSYSAEAGSTFSVDIIFRETATEGENLMFFTAPTGLTSLGPVRVTYQPVGPATDVLQVADEADIEVGGLFTGLSFKLIDNPNFVSEVGGENSSGIKIGSNATFHEVNLATITFTVVGAPGQSSLLGLNPNDFGEVFFNNEIFPAATASFGSATFSVVAVPEPSSIAMVGFAIAAGGLQWRRRRAKRS
ncbi:PEP-CTERM motif protein [Rubripirellula tenax]|uniref:PEP-CTERM motif protein n=1 Tax=Rubripirellula tenax TaxID=2528015 RepID=A0A5C6EJI8_9BACT|nr:PEP-CTERM sorting domain-containing protein [Rubripirellula tenax]TWU48670.1 PEP-CTERM motif protein [Rubripirellula tenax]